MNYLVTGMVYEKSKILKKLDKIIPDECSRLKKEIEKEQEEIDLILQQK